MKLPRCDGSTVMGRCSFSGKWKSGDKNFCNLHRPDRVRHAAEVRSVRALRDDARAKMYRAAIGGNFDDCSDWAQHLHEHHTELMRLITEGRAKFGYKGRTPMPLPAWAR